mmetsp:Transcript_68694/g.128161  ORF Transcript_68694/g.128161 Transcript_68694/m.128161 type:complete len:227 (-) Transcript_68694:17-697(-)
MFVVGAYAYRAAMPRNTEDPVGVCMCCIPLRLGIFIFAMYILLTSLCAIAGALSPDVGYTAGGFTPGSFAAMVFFGCVGSIGGIIGLNGLGDNSVPLVRLFGYTAIVRFIAVLIIAWVDSYQLDTCRHLSGTRVALTDAYSDALLRVSLSGTCTAVFTAHLLLLWVDVVVYAFGIMATFKWCHAVGTCPAYHIVVGEAQPVKLYTGYGAVDGKLPKDGKDSAENAA